MAHYPKILGLLGLGSDKEALTEAHMQAAEEKITQLEQGKTDAESKLATAETNLKTAQDEKATATSALEEEKKKTATLEEWKKNQKAVDGRDEDDSNSLDEGQKEALAPWEKAAASAIDTAKRRVGK